MHENMHVNDGRICLGLALMLDFAQGWDHIGLKENWLVFLLYDSIGAQCGDW